jgi:hypothetical protein
MLHKMLKRSYASNAVGLDINLQIALKEITIKEQQRA